jgi:hypothetical protein
LKTNIVSFKNRLKTRVALIELLDLSGIAVGNVGVPTCLPLVCKIEFFLLLRIYYVLSSVLCRGV